MWGPTKGEGEEGGGGRGGEGDGQGLVDSYRREAADGKRRQFLECRRASRRQVRLEKSCKPLKYRKKTEADKLRGSKAEREHCKTKERRAKKVQASVERGPKWRMSEKMQEGYVHTD